MTETQISTPIKHFNSFIFISSTQRGWYLSLCFRLSLRKCQCGTHNSILFTLVGMIHVSLLASSLWRLLCFPSGCRDSCLDSFPHCTKTQIYLWWPTLCSVAVVESSEYVQVGEITAQQGSCCFFPPSTLISWAASLKILLHSLNPGIQQSEHIPFLEFLVCRLKLVMISFHCQTTSTLFVCEYVLHNHINLFVGCLTANGSGSGHLQYSVCYLRESLKKFVT